MEFEDLKLRSNTFDKNNSNNKPIKINLANFHLNENKNIINTLLINTNKLPRLSLSNFHKRNSNNNKDLNELKNFKINIFNKTSGIIGFKGITFNKGLSTFRNTNYKLNNINNKNLKPLISFNDTFKYQLIKEQLFNKNKILNNNNIDNNIQIIDNNINNEKERKKIIFNKNSFNIKAIINNDKNNNPINNNINMNLFKKSNKKIKLDKNDNKIIKIKEENQIKNNLYEENNDSFIKELNDLFPNSKQNNESQQKIDENDDNNESDDDKEPDPRINFEQINRVNKSRPQTSYGGLNARRKNLQSAFQNRKNRPITSNVPE